MSDILKYILFGFWNAYVYFDNEIIYLWEAIRFSEGIEYEIWAGLALW